MLRYSESGTYDFASAFHIPHLSLHRACSWRCSSALMNSADDIIRDRAVLHRERNLNVRLPYYVLAKFSSR